MSTSVEEAIWQELSLTKLVPEARHRLIKFGAPLLLTEAEGRLALAEHKIKAFERKYRTTLVRLCQEGLPDDASMEMHEDFIEWSGWQRTREEAQQIIASLEHVMEKPLAPAAAG